MVGTLLTLALALPSAFFFHRAHRLTVDFPNLHDPSPNVDGYWPAVVHAVYTGIAIILAAGSMICAVASTCILALRRGKLRSVETASGGELTSGRTA